uniref:Uncharacterized protein n=1 Tax=Phytophthora infestans TaxID=4787 RepID=Q572H4_PHYIN|nr:hypothetical protein PI49.0090c [Phytophthora infestans]
MRPGDTSCVRPRHVYCDRARSMTEKPLCPCYSSPPVYRFESGGYKRKCARVRKPRPSQELAGYVQSKSRPCDLLKNGKRRQEHHGYMWILLWKRLGIGMH